MKWYKIVLWYLQPKVLKNYLKYIWNKINKRW